MFTRLLLFLIVITTATLFSQGQKMDEDCDDGKGECKVLLNCPPITSNFAAVFDSIKFCDGDLVCCPKRTVLVDSRYLSDDDQLKKSVQECRAYRKSVYPKCDPQALIVGGVNAEPKEFPHMALLGTKWPNNTFSWYCGGTLISPKYVVSAAHCFSYETITHVRLGDLDFSITTDDAQPQDFTVKDSIIHPAFDDDKKYNDIVLIELDRAATLNEYVAPACLPLRHNGTEFQQFIAAGWGVTKFATSDLSTHLQKVKLERFSDDACKNLVDITDSLHDGVRERIQICAGSYVDKRDTCQGDSGGPLFVEHPDFPCMYLLVGITSFGSSCGIPGSPGVYVRVNLYVDWIEGIVWNVPK